VNLVLVLEEGGEGMTTDLQCCGRTYRTGAVGYSQAERSKVMVT